MVLDLKDTIKQMESESYKERFKAEYNQLNIRLSKLESFVEKYKNGELDFEPDCSIELLSEQAFFMRGYLDALIKRANIEKIEFRH